jgi:Ca2+-binding RTX toxin-like protein
VKGGDQALAEGITAQQTVVAWATSISSGPLDEPQNLNFIVTSNNESLFSQVPAINAATGTLTYAIAAGKEGTATVTVRLHDDGGTEGDSSDTSPPQTFTITVNNVAPTAGITGATKGVPGLALKYTLTATDPSAADAAAGFHFVVNWGDGTTSMVDAPSGAVVTHTFLAVQNFAISATAQDRDLGLSGAAPASVSITTALFQDGKLYVGGGSGPDAITIAAANKLGTKVIAKLGVVVLGTFALSSRNSIVVYGNAGNDKIAVGSTVAIPAELHGGAGNDLLQGGNAADRLYGEAGNDLLNGRGGNDQLFGGDGRDVLIGGLGSDKLYGNAVGILGTKTDENLLIGDRTTYETTDKALLQVLTTWSGPGNVKTKAIKLRAGVAGVKLTTATVLDDKAVDQLVGTTGANWFWRFSRDKLVGKKATDPLN